MRQSRFQSKELSPGIEGNFIMITGSVHQEDIVILNIYADRVHEKASKSIPQNFKELQEETDNSATIIKDFNIRLSIMARKSKHKISKNIKELDIYRTFCQTTTEYILCIFTKMDCVCTTKQVSINLKDSSYTKYILWLHEMKLEIRKRKTFGKSQNI